MSRFFALLALVLALVLTLALAPAALGQKDAEPINSAERAMIVKEIIVLSGAAATKEIERSTAALDDPLLTPAWKREFVRLWKAEGQPQMDKITEQELKKFLLRDLKFIRASFRGNLGKRSVEDQKIFDKGPTGAGLRQLQLLAEKLSKEGAKIGRDLGEQAAENLEKWKT